VLLLSQHRGAHLRVLVREFERLKFLPDRPEQTARTCPGACTPISSLPTSAATSTSARTILKLCCGVFTPTSCSWLLPAAGGSHARGLVAVGMCLAFRLESASPKRAGRSRDKQRMQ
jgi:hypothetical protein